MLPSLSTTIPSAFTRPISLPLASLTIPSSPITPIIFPSGPIAYLVFPFTVSYSMFRPELPELTEPLSQKLQSSLLIALPNTGTSSCLALSLPTFVSCQIILKLFCTFSATVGVHFMVTIQVILPRKTLSSQFVSKENPSNGASSSSTEMILIDLFPFVPTVKTLLASLPKTT